MKEYSYVLITPYSLHKSRTGGIIGRILSNTELDLCAVKMYAPSNAMVDEYIESVREQPLSDHNRTIFCNYIDVNLRANNPSGISNRCMFLVFHGEDSTSILRRVIGHVTYKPIGDTVRGTYGDYITHDGSVVYFEPAVINPTNTEAAERDLRIFSHYAVSDGGVITEALDGLIENKDNNQITLVMLKPENFHTGSSRPGTIIDMFSKTGLYIVGAKLLRFSMYQAEEFYKPLKAIFETRLEKEIRKRIISCLIPGLPFRITDEEIEVFTKMLRQKNAQYEFNRIIKYITGLDPDTVSQQDRLRPGKEKCLVLLYYGQNAISNIREKLGSTDPKTAKEGTVRHEFGDNILKNGAHASDSPESALRERKIVGLMGYEESELTDPQTDLNRTAAV